MDQYRFRLKVLQVPELKKWVYTKWIFLQQTIRSQHLLFFQHAQCLNLRALLFTSKVESCRKKAAQNLRICMYNVQIHRGCNYQHVWDSRRCDHNYHETETCCRFHLCRASCSTVVSCVEMWPRYLLHVPLRQSWEFSGQKTGNWGDIWGDDLCMSKGFVFPRISTWVGRMLILLRTQLTN